MARADSESVMIRPRKPSVRRSWEVMTAGGQACGTVWVSPGTLALAIMIEGMPAWMPAVNGGSATCWRVDPARVLAGPLSVLLVAWPSPGKCLSTGDHTTVGEPACEREAVLGDGPMWCR
jgi:hypothetical protein